MIRKTNALDAEYKHYYHYRYEYRLNSYIIV